ncbi:hypothetical protein E2562_004603 [Oryza meyeriana var. granulata]|uniref:Uncharacterized protein n=1 Tax=Oryza meyeriana var. granulata TaxID=110450 RepID=A0A6G1F3M4_9ORYZ|nr:hypothetical protein E2562_004603 [Oryza meyeriana var. granulata]
MASRELTDGARVAATADRRCAATVGRRRRGRKDGGDNAGHWGAALPRSKQLQEPVVCSLQQREA